MRKILSVTIGIPAYNEANNIANLLRRLIRQSVTGFVIKKILVISDGSTDETVDEAMTIKDMRIVIIDGKRRMGKAARLNYIFKHTNTDYLITVDADASPNEESFIQKIVDNYIDNNEPSLTSVRVEPVANLNSIVSRVLAHSQQMKLDMFRKIQKTKPVYASIGRSFGYSRDLYSKLVFPHGIIAEDAYACLYCIKHNLKVSYLDKAVIYYAPPATISDHLKQSTRFYNSEFQLADYFGTSFVKSSYSIQKRILIRYALLGLLRAPFLTLAYTMILVYTKIISSLHWVKSSYLWDASESSKKLDRNI